MSVPDLGAGSCRRGEKHRAADLLCLVPTWAMMPSSTGGGRGDSPRRDSAPSPGSEVWTPCGSREGRVTVDGELPGAPLDPCHTPCAGPLAPQPALTPGLPQPRLGASGRPSPWAPHLQPCPAPRPPTLALPSPRLLVVCRRFRICTVFGASAALKSLTSYGPQHLPSGLSHLLGPRGVPHLHPGLGLTFCSWHSALRLS